MTNPGTILLVEDNANDVFLMETAFAEAKVSNPLQTVSSGAEALKYLSGDGAYADRTAHPVPFLILLDLKMPGDDGFGVLRWLHDRPGLRKKFILIVMSAGSPEHEVKLAYELGAQSYILKPLDYKDLVACVRRIKEYWIETNRLPGCE